MIETWRWFGPEDNISLNDIAQAGAAGIVSSLHGLSAGDEWPLADIIAHKELIESAGLQWSVIESIPVHNDIKSRSGEYRQYLDNYIQSIKNVAAAGLTTVCYNFMPVVDWTRTNLRYRLDNGSYSLRFDMIDFVAYDLFILQRPNAEKDYPAELGEHAKKRLQAWSNEDKALLEENIIAGLPGGEGSYNRDTIRQQLQVFSDLGTEKLRQNFFLFLQEIIPVAEACGVNMCVHPDDPPFSLFGIPRVVSTVEDIRLLVAAQPSLANGITFCAGSYGARADNQLVDMAAEFADRIYFAHLRNIKREADGSFYESDHLDGDNDMIGLIELIIKESQRRADPNKAIPIRADHGLLIGEEINNANVKPGYSYLGRLRGLAEIRGVATAIERGLINK